MFSFNPLHSKSSKNDIVLSSDVVLSKSELIEIKNKIEEERIVDFPCWIYVGSKMYLIHKKEQTIKQSKFDINLEEKSNEIKIKRGKQNKSKTLVT
jgi:hypothetical protein